MGASPAKLANGDVEYGCKRGFTNGDDDGAAVGDGGVASHGLSEAAERRLPTPSAAPKPTALRPGGARELPPGAARAPEPLIVESRDIEGDDSDESAAEYDDSAD